MGCRFLIFGMEMGDGLQLVMDRSLAQMRKWSCSRPQSKCQTTRARDSDPGLWDLLPAFPHCALPLPANVREQPSRARRRHEGKNGPSRHQSQGPDRTAGQAAEQDWLRGSLGQL